MDPGRKNDGPLPKLVRPRRTRDAAVRVLVVVIILGVVVICAAGVVSTAVNLTYRAGWAGTPGALTRVVCHIVPANRGHDTECVGTFTTPRPGVFVPFARVEGDRDYPAGRYPARLHADGETVSVVGAASVLFILSGMTLALAGLALFGGLGGVGIGVLARRGNRGPDFRRPAYAVLGFTALCFVASLALLVAGYVAA